MARLFVIFFLSIFYCSLIWADHTPIVIRSSGSINDHSVIYPPADQPAVYYDSNNQVLIIDGLGEVSHYDVEITPIVSNNPVITTQVDGNYDTIDVSSLPDDNYEIVLTSSYNNVFEGYFTM